MRATRCYRSESSALALENSPHWKDSLHILELDIIEFKQLPEGNYFLNVCFYNFRSRCFVGNQLAVDCVSNASHINIKQNIVACSCADSDSVIVIELANCDKMSLGWTVISQRDVVEQMGPITHDTTSGYKPMLQR